VIGLMLLGLVEAMRRPGPFFHYQKRADVEVDFQAVNVLAETVEVIRLPLIFSPLS